ncbi:unnamed protein product [Laminaria digitata]
MLNPEWADGASALPGKEEAMLCFWNIASDTSILKDNPKDVRRMKAMLCDLANNIHLQGTLIIAMEKVWTFDFSHIAEVLASEGFVLEDHPVYSVYLAGHSGRIPNNKKQDYASHGALALVAHKTPTYFCRSAGTRRAPSSRMASSSSSSGQEEVHREVLEAAGVIVSAKHPEAGTFLAVATAEHFIKRFSSVGDAVLVTAADKQSLASPVLGTGRTIMAVVSDGAKEAGVCEQLDVECEDALQRGFFAHLCRPPKRIGPSLLPKCVPTSNVSASVMAEVLALNDCMEEDDDDEDGDDGQAREEARRESALKVAKKHADLHGVEIKESPKGGLGIFAKRELRPEEVPPIPLMGDFTVYDHAGQLTKAMERDGVPRYQVCKRGQFLKMLESWEVSNEGATLYLKPDPSSFLYYINSCEPRIEDLNTEASSVFEKHDAATSGVAKTKVLLRNSNEGVVFKLTRTINKGEELLSLYPLFPGSKGMEGAGSEGVEDGGGGGGSEEEGGGSEDDKEPKRMDAFVTVAL